MNDAGAGWRYLKLLYRARYAVLTILAPTAIAVAALALPQVLRGLLLVDPGSWRLVWLTWISAMVVALGLAIFRVIDLHGDARMGESSPEIWNEKITHGRVRLFWDKTSIGWPLVPIVVWAISSVVYPASVVRASLQELAAGGSTTGLGAAMTAGVLGIVQGMMLAAASLFLLALLRTLLVGAKSAGSGLVLGEGLAHWLVSRFRPNLSERRMPMLYFPFHFAGVTDPKTKRLLPGHPQLLVAMVVSVVVYLVWYYRTVASDDWSQPDWPVGFYLLLLTYCSSAIFSFLTFILDRYHIPVTITIAIYVGLIADAHRFYELTPTTVDRPTLATQDAASNLLTEAISQRDQPPLPRPYLEDLYGLDPQRHYVFPKWSDGKRTMVVVTASGGGIQAAAWTAQVLTGLDQRSPQISESIGLMSSVSGGSVGVMHYLAQRQPRTNNPAAPLSQALDPAQQILVNNNAQASSLEAVGWGMAFPDFSRTISPIQLNPLIDRGWALEASWWGRLGPNPSFARQMQSVRIRDLVRPIREGRMPPVVFNATAVETGQRVMISPVHTEATRPGPVINYQNVQTPIDLIDFYGDAVTERQQINPRLTTAVRLSATFAYVTPVARPLPPAEDLIRPGFQSRFDMHLCDGGYADNTGLVTAIRLVHDLVVSYHAQMDADPSFKPPFDRVIFVRIEPFPESAVEIVGDSSGLKAALLGPAAALAATRTSTQAERADLELALLMDMSSASLGAAQDEISLLEIRRRAFDNAVEAVDLAGDDYVRLRDALSEFKATADRLATDDASQDDLEDKLALVQVEAIRVSDERSDAIVAAAEDFSQTQPPESNRIEIKTVLIRFGTPATQSLSELAAPGDDAVREPSGQHHPPLSWLLAQSDINALGHSWKMYEEAFDAAPGVAAAAAATDLSKPWNTSNQQLSSGTLHPGVFGSLAAGSPSR